MKRPAKLAQHSLFGGPVSDLHDPVALARAEAVYDAVVLEEWSVECRARRTLQLLPAPARDAPQSLRESQGARGERVTPRGGHLASKDEHARIIRHVDPRALRLHPHADLVPRSTDKEYAALRNDVARDGVLEPLQVRGSTVLDGRHRLLAALELKLATVPVIEAQLAEGESAEGFILRTALHRRQLSDDQRAMMAALWARRVEGAK